MAMAAQMWIFGIFLIFIRTSAGSWGTPGLGQYHIQTDEGPERYFRYQTDSGQYRKEKRLQDGTVIGTDAWIDASGFLRQKDYIADHKGYRILKSKTVFVGKGRSIEEAIKSVKSVPAHAGTLVRPGLQPSVNYNPSTYYSPPTTTTIPTRSSFYPTNVTPSNYLGYDHYPTPQVYIRPHSQPVENTYTPYYGSTTSSYYPTSTANPLNSPVRTFEPPYDKRVQPIAAYTPSTTPSPLTANYGPPVAAYPSSTPANSISSTSPSYSSTSYPSTTLAPPYSTTNRPDAYSTNDGYRSYSPISSTSGYQDTTARPVVPLSNNNIDVQPLYTRPPSVQAGYPSRYHAQGPLQYNNNLGSGYDPQYPLYDGVAVTHNGFRYYLPRQYHEEENLDGQSKAGSFGYIDPFGIRRVIYYNASPGQGFVHRKNNRYVGFNATPYDPRPL